MIRLTTPIAQNEIDRLKVGDRILLSGEILTGRDAVLPRLAKLVDEGRLHEIDAELCGNVIFHTAVSPAGVGPTSSNKLEIEESFGPLSRAGIKIHLGKGAISPRTVEALWRYGSVFAVIPPVTALLKNNTFEQCVVAFEEEGMEALHCIRVVDYPAIIAAAHRVSIYDVQHDP